MNLQQHLNGDDFKWKRLTTSRETPQNVQPKRDADHRGATSSLTQWGLKHRVLSAFQLL